MRNAAVIMRHAAVIMRQFVSVGVILASLSAILASLSTISGVQAEFCDPYIDRQNQLQEGFRCPVKEVVPSGGKNFNGEESYCCGSCIYKFCCNTIENRVDQSDCDLGEIRRNMLSPPTFTASGGGGGGTKPQNISLKGGKVRSSKVNEFEVIDPMGDDDSTKFGGGGGGDHGSGGGDKGGKDGSKAEKGVVEIVKDGIKIKLDQAIEDAKGGDIGSVIGVIVAGVFTVIVVLVAFISCVICCCRKSKSKRQQWRQGGGSGAPGVKRSLSSASLHHGAEGKGESKRHSALYPSIPNTPMNTNGRYSSAGRLSKVRDYISYSLPHSRGREPRQPLWGHEGSRKSFNAQAFFSRQQMRNLQDRYTEGGDSDESATATPSPVHRAISASKSRSRGGHCNTIHGGGACNCHHGGGGCGGGCGGGNHHGGCGGGDGGVRPQSCCVGGYGGGGDGGGNGANFPPPPPNVGQPGFNMPNGMVPQAFANPYAYPNPAMVPFPTGGSHHPQQHGNLPPSMIASYPPPSHTPSAMSPFTSSGLYPQVSQALEASGVNSPLGSSAVVSAASPLPPPPPPENGDGATQPTAPPQTGSLTQPPAFNPHYV